jgi:hypothetical protein
MRAVLASNTLDVYAPCCVAAYRMDPSAVDLTCFTLDGWNPRIRPASSRRDWMEATPERFAYRCLPLAIANAHGWEVLSPCGFEARWNGGPLVEDVEVRVDPGSGPRVPSSLFGQGTITLHIEGIIRTPPGWNLWVSGPPNGAKDAISPLGGVIESDWSPYTFTMNWRFTRPDQWIRFDENEPFCFFFPVERALFDRIEPRIRSLDEAPELKDAFQNWSASRDAFQKWVAETNPAAPSDRWQKLYYRGLFPNGDEGPQDHRAKLRVPAFVGINGEELWPDDAAPPRAPSAAPSQTCPVIIGSTAAVPPFKGPLLAQALEALKGGNLVAGAQALRSLLLDQQGALLSAGDGASRISAEALDRREWVLDNVERQLSLSSGAEGIAELSKISSEEFLSRFYARSRPVVLRGAVADWPALTRWTPEYLKQAVGPVEIEFQGGRNDSPEFELYKDNHKRRLSFDKFIDMITTASTGNDAYLTAYNSASNRDALAPLNCDLGTIDDILTGAPGMLWIGPGGTFTPLHFDLTNNLLAQVVGTKHLVLLPPSETGKLANTTHVFSEVHDITDPDRLALYPAAASARQFEVVLEPGDLLYIPVGWWHQVVSEDFSAMLTYTDFLWPNDAYERFPVG